MAWIMKSVQNGQRRYCNQVCWFAEGGNCNCICGGENHGKGFDTVTESIDELHKKLQKASEFEIVKRQLDKDMKPVKVHETKKS